MSKLPGRAARLCAALLLAATVTGCASSGMKGTPFYTGEYDIRNGEASDRVNLWPVVYYRKPALSVLWPVIEVTDDHVAVRPFMSVYGRKGGRPVVNVLWPIAQFDPARHRHRVFPAFWGENYAAVFPLYWHFTSPASGKVTDGLIPLWWYSRDRKGYDLNVIPPVFNVKNRGDNRGWRAWPLAGRYRNGEDRYSFFLWPLGHAWKSAGEKGSAFFPVYGYVRDGGGRTLVSLPYSFHRSTPVSNGAPDWDLVLPLWWSSRGRDEAFWATPIAGGGGTGDGRRRWQYVFPLYIRQKDGEETSFVTVLGGFSEKAAGETSWAFLPGLSWGNRSAHGYEANILGPLARWSRMDQRRTGYVFPLYLSRSEPGRSMFVSLPWSSGRDTDGSDWQLAFPLMFRRAKGADERLLLTPLYAAGSRPDRRWHALVPLYYTSSGDAGRVFATLLGGVSMREEGKKWLLYPLLSGGQWAAGAGDLWIVAPLFHLGWNGQGRTSHLLPFYYWDGRTRTFASPLAAHWRDADGRGRTLIPPALSLHVQREKRSDLWMAAGLARASWGEKPGPQHVFPLFYRNPGSGTFLTPLYARWKDGDREGRAIPPLLSGWSRGRDSTRVVAAAGLFQNERSRGTKPSWGYAFPLYYYRGGGKFLTPLFGWDRSRSDKYMYPLTPLVGIRGGDHTGGWVFPLFSHRAAKDGSNSRGWFLWGGYRRYGRHLTSGMFPFYSYKSDGSTELAGTEGAGTGSFGRDMFVFPSFWYENRVSVWRTGRVENGGGQLAMSATKKNGMFPLWSYSRQKSADGQATVRSSVVLLLHDYLRRTGTKAGQVDNYVRSRVLWRLWHFERLNDDVSVDVFPAITYDRRGAEFRKTSFLWRLFRYERDGRSRKLDVLFVPVLRTGKGVEPEGKERANG